MSNREKCNEILDSFSEMQLVNIVALLQAAQNAINDAPDDAFCNALYKEYRDDPENAFCLMLATGLLYMAFTMFSYGP